MARPAVQGSPVDFSAVAATTVTSGTVSGLQAGDLILVWVGMRSASARNVASITDTIAASGDLAWDHASDDDGGVSNNLRDAQNVQQAELWRAYVQPGDNTSGTITVNVSASTSTLYCRAVVVRASAGGTLSIDQHASADQGATDTDPGTVSITPTVDSLVVAFSGNRQDQFVDFDGTLTAIGSPAEAGSTGDQMDWHAGYADGTASTPQTCTFDYAAVSEWIVQAVSVEEEATAGSNALAGAIASASTVSGSLSVSKPLAGAVASASTVAGAVTVIRPLAGAVTSASTVTGALTVPTPLAGTVTSTSAVTGTLTATVSLAASVSSASTITGALLVTKPLAGQISSASTVTGTLTNTAPGGIPLAGGITTASSVAGALTVRTVLAGTVTSASTVTGALTNTAAGSNALAGTITAASTVTGSLLVTKPLAGTVAAASTVTGALTARVGLAGQVTSASSMSGALIVRHPLTGQIVAASTLTGTVVVARPLAGIVAAVSQVIGELTNQGPVTSVGRLEAGLTVTLPTATQATQTAPESLSTVTGTESTGGVSALIE